MASTILHPSSDGLQLNSKRNRRAMASTLVAMASPWPNALCSLQTDQDLPAANTWWQWLQQKCIQIVRSRWFEFLAGFMILLWLGQRVCLGVWRGVQKRTCIHAVAACLRNLITIGIEAHVSVTEGTVYNSDFWPGGDPRLWFVVTLPVA